jgi:SAM-dependent methyltransferase
VSLFTLREPVQIAKGLASRIPGLARSPKGGEAPSASYGYNVWMKHLWHLWKNGLRKMPETVVELGPGQSLGVGLAALLSGANAYYGLDSAHICDLRTNASLLDEMVHLFRGRAGQQIRGWPSYGPEFPDHILPQPLLDAALSPDRKEDIARAVDHDSPITIRYIAPWEDQSIERGSADLVLSHVVMQYFSDLETIYTTMYDWLRPGGMISHQIDFSGLQFARGEWNSHWSRSERTWRMIAGNRPGAIGRMPFSAHVDAIRSAGFEIACAMINPDQGGIPREALASRWAALSDSDLHARGGFIQALKPSG